MSDTEFRNNASSSEPNGSFNPRTRNPRQNASGARPERYTVSARDTSASAPNTGARAARRPERDAARPASNRGTEASAAQRERQRNASAGNNPRAARGELRSAGNARPAASAAQRSNRTRATGQPAPTHKQAPTAQVRVSNPAKESRTPSGSKRRSPLLFIIPIVAAAAIGFGVFNIISPAQFEVTLNGQQVTMHRGDTIATVLEQKLAEPVPGNLIAVDDSVIEEGAGEPFAATLNEEAVTDTTLRLYKEDVLTIDDGADIMEEYSTETIEVEPVRTEEGWGAIHAYVKGETGTIERRTGKTSGITVDETTKEVVNESYIMYHADTNGEKVVAITLDDGPWPGQTDEALDILEENGVKATFFVIGNQVADHPDTMKRMAEAGHQICTHTWDHAAGSGQGVNLTYMSSEEQIQEIEKGIEAIESVTGTEASRVIRAPGGNYSGSIIWTLSDYVTAEIGWDVDTEDWRLPGSDVIAQRIMSAQPGDIVLMHDGGGDRSQTLAALRIAIPYLKEQGYKFVTIDELMAYNNPVDMVKTESTEA